MNVYYTLNLTVFFPEPQNPTPTITITSSDDQPLNDKAEVTVKMEGLVMIKDNSNIDMSLALGAVIAIYHIYNFEYPAQLKKTFTFIEAFVLKVEKSEIAYCCAEGCQCTQTVNPPPRPPQKTKKRILPLEDRR